MAHLVSGWVSTWLASWGCSPPRITRITPLDGGLHVGKSQGLQVLAALAQHPSMGVNLNKELLVANKTRWGFMSTRWLLIEIHSHVKAGTAPLSFDTVQGLHIASKGTRKPSNSPQLNMVGIFGLTTPKVGTFIDS